jgi:hypothetical protein
LGGGAAPPPAALALTTPNFQLPTPKRDCLRTVRLGVGSWRLGVDDRSYLSNLIPIPPIHSAVVAEKSDKPLNVISPMA